MVRDGSAVFDDSRVSRRAGDRGRMLALSRCRVVALSRCRVVALSRARVLRHRRGIVVMPIYTEVFINFNN
ncbi:hypothetical protein CUJ89_16310 [Burkholderia pyrrocinia]|uniref:Uncharacterized protein n=1 Tax=Burkholderia pyrrocinia TaxID=60550 RepID=A0A2Z5MX94_BURPY|nr:hypothetical protein CUJ89_16310 [Burkholderia pyrrocinia]